jgi:hypothetical protein
MIVYFKTMLRTFGIIEGWEDIFDREIFLELLLDF